MTLINDFLSLIYPRHCEACTNVLLKHEKYICNYCLVALPKFIAGQGADNELSRVFAGRVPLNYGLSLYSYQKSTRVQKLLHAIKYQGQKELAVFLGNMFGADLNTKAGELGFNEIIPVPLHKNKLKKRGFNQSEYFALGLAEALKIPINNAVLERVVETSTQTKKKRYKRWENVDGIFKLREPGKLNNKHILLVDDVITTGATIEAAWQALQNEEGITISVASIAFASKGFG
jgi:ComF family protein